VSAEPQFGAEEAAKRAQMEAAIARIEAEQQHYRNAAIWPTDIAAAVKINPRAWEAWLASLPESENIEDRRNLAAAKDEEEEFHRKRGRTERKSIGEWPKAKE
jgi:hypothetical protein